MFIQYEEVLKYYYNAFLDVCKNKNKYNTKLEKLNTTSTLESLEKPFWFGNEKFHRSHRSRLIVKNREFYLPQFPNDDNYNQGRYWWPDMSTKTFKII